MPLLSVVVPALNEAEGIAATLEPLQSARAAGDVEVLVVDGGSEDDTAAIAARHADQVVSTSRGRARQMNAGADAASGDYLLFLHADTRLTPSILQLLLFTLQSDAPVWARFDVRLDGDEWMFRVVETLMNVRSRLTSIATGDQAVVVRRQTFEELGGYADIPIMEDIEFSARIRRVARPMCMRTRVSTSARRWQSHGILRTIVLMWFMRAAYACGVSPSKLKSMYVDNNTARHRA